MVNQNVKLTQKDIVNSKSATCEECGCESFKNEFLIKVVSALVSPTGKELHVPIPVFACAKCSHVNKSFMPENT